MKKFIYVGICVCLVLGGFVGGVVIRKDAVNELQKTNRDLQMVNDRLLKDLFTLKNINNVSDNEKNDNTEIKKCDFIRTYKIFHILNDYHNVLEKTFVLVDEYQNFSPFVVEVPTEFVKDLKVGEYYEFHFYGEDILSNGDYEIKRIDKTDRMGLDQIQEVCN